MGERARERKEIVRKISVKTRQAEVNKITSKTQGDAFPPCVSS